MEDHEAFSSLSETDHENVDQFVGSLTAFLAGQDEDPEEFRQAFARLYESGARAELMRAAEIATLNAIDIRDNASYTEEDFTEGRPEHYK